MVHDEEKITNMIPAIIGTRPNNSIALHKSGIRLLGVDDSPFRRGQQKSFIVGVIMRLDGYIEKVMKAQITIDGNDVTERISNMALKFKDIVRVIVLSGISFGGFNICDIELLFKLTGIPVISLFEKGGSASEMINAINKHLGDQEKIGILKRLKPIALNNNGYTIMANLAGIESESASRIIRMNTVRGKMPEAVRVPDLIAKIL
ncbi:DUF99 family protein [Thermoplasma volcanium]|nr:DUF99 family protein [Thermoplasma volcanium]